MANVWQGGFLRDEETGALALSVESTGVAKTRTYGLTVDSETVTPDQGTSRVPGALTFDVATTALVGPLYVSAVVTVASDDPTAQAVLFFKLGIGGAQVGDPVPVGETTIDTAELARGLAVPGDPGGNVVAIDVAWDVPPTDAETATVTVADVLAFAVVYEPEAA